MNKTGAFYNTVPEEQETIINVDYAGSKVSIYTSKKSIYERISKKIGQPKNTYYTDKKISGANWIIPFSDKKSITSILSRPTLIGNIK